MITNLMRVQRWVRFVSLTVVVGLFACSTPSGQAEAPDGTSSDLPMSDIGDAAVDAGMDLRAQDQSRPDDERGQQDAVEFVPDLDVSDLAEGVFDVVDPPQPLVAEAGFVEIEPVSFVIRNGGWHTKSFTSSKARIWYAFQPADENPETKPLAIFFNGGPGSATSLLFGYNTGKFTVDPQVTGSEPFALNPDSWTRFANLLYVDARETGFSYNLIFDAYLKASRKGEFGTQNFNSLFDGADFLRVLLRFLARHPALQANPVLIVGESYGGVRATVMSYLLLNYSEMGAGKIVYQDKALAQEIQAHLDVVVPELAGTRVPKETLAKQFGHMAMIQPLISGDYQSEVAGQMFRQNDSVIYQVAQQTGTTYEPCPASSPSCDDEQTAMMFVYEVAVRDLYNVSQPLGWMDDAAAAINMLLVQPELLSELLQIDLATLPEMFSVNRLDAYRWGNIPYLPRYEPPLSQTPSAPPSLTPSPLTSPPPSLTPPSLTPVRLTRALAATPAQMPFPARLESARGALMRQNKLETGAKGLETVFGILRSWDQFFVGLHEDVNRAFYLGDSDYLNIQPYDTMYGEMFLYSIRYVKTFVTRAAYDIVIYAPAIPEALCKHTDLVLECDYQPGESDPRRGTIRFSYLSDAFGPEEGPAEATVLFPSYDSSGHPVEVTEPDLLLQDVMDWYLGQE